MERMLVIKITKKNPKTHASQRTEYSTTCSGHWHGKITVFFLSDFVCKSIFVMKIKDSAVYPSCSMCVARYGTGATGRWYYWKVKPDEITVWTRLFPWLCYVGHQLLIWGTIFYAQTTKVWASHQ